MKPFFFSTLGLLLATLGLFSFWTFHTLSDWKSRLALETWEAEADRALEGIKDAYRHPASASENLEAAAGALDNLRGYLAEARIFEQSIFTGAVLGIVELALLFALLALGLWWIGRRQIFSPLTHLAKTLQGWDLKTPLKLYAPAGSGEVRILFQTLDLLQQRLGEYEGQIREAEREQVARFLVHQLKNRMTSLSLGASVLEAAEPGSEKAGRSLKLIRNSLGDMQRMLDQFRMVSRFPEPRKCAVPVKKLVSEAASALGIDLGVEIEDALEVQADPLLLKESLVNLIQNAREAQGPEPHPPVTVAADHQSLIVRDAGPGFPAEVLRVQGRGMETTKQQGMGLGLAFVIKTAEAHGWKFELSNNPSGGGMVRMIWNQS